MRYGIILTLFIASLLPAVAWSNTDRSIDPIRIGLIAYTKDEHQRRVGTPALNAAHMAVEDVNRAGGIRLGDKQYPVELVVEGIASSPQNAIAAMRRLTNLEQVTAVIGANYSVDAIPAGHFAEKARTPFISPMSTNPRTTEGRNYVFRMSFLDEKQGQVMADFVFERLGSRRAALLYNRPDPYSHDIAAVFIGSYVGSGGKVVVKEGYVDLDHDLEPSLDLIEKAAPDVIYLPNFSNEALRQVRAIRKRGIDVPLLGADGWSPGEFSTYPEFDNTYMTVHWFAGADRFSTRYMERYGVEPEAVSALTFDAFNLLFQAIGRSGRLDRETIRQQLIDMPSFHGVSGDVDFIDSGDPDKMVKILGILDGKVQSLGHSNGGGVAP